MSLTTPVRNESTLLDLLETIPIPNQYYIENGVQQKLENQTWKYIFDYIRKEHWHSIVNEKGREEANCPHKESLYEHSLQCGSICYQEAIQMHKEKPELFWLTGLLHDIGKCGTRTKGYSGKHTAFFGHAIVGGAILEKLWTDELGQAFQITYEDWGHLISAANVHMCGYFPQCEQSNKSIYTHSFQLFHPSTRELISVLRLGDNLGMIHRDTDEASVKEKVLSTQGLFEDYMKENLDLKEFVSSHELKNGVLIQMQGSSAQGKSSMSVCIREKLISLGIPENHIHIISRDMYMVQTTLEAMRKPLLKNKEELTPQIYTECYNFYQVNKKTYADVVNRKMMNDIQDGLSSHHIVITDTMATAYDKAASKIIPDSAKNSFKLSIWMHRNKPITEQESLQRLGMNLQKQLEVTGDNSVFNPYSKSIIWNLVTSLGEARADAKNYPNYYIRPHVSISHGWDSKLRTKELDYLLGQIKDIYTIQSSFLTIPTIEQTTNMTLEELLHTLYKIDTQRPDEIIKTFFKRYAYHVSQPWKGTKFEKNVYGIKYLDGINQIWKHRWSREARGRFYWVSQDECVCLKYTLQRGIELYTKSHKDAGIEETQDVIHKNFDRFDSRQQKLLTTFSKEDQEINIVATTKGDGSLILFTYYRNHQTCRAYSIMQMLRTDLPSSVNPNLFLDLDNFGLLTVSTQGTLIMANDMLDYLVTALHGIFKLALPEASVSASKAWKNPELQVSFRDWISKIYVCLPNYLKREDSILTIDFECICANRTTYKGFKHIELAVSYDRSYMKFLGSHVKDLFCPHFVIYEETKNLLDHPVAFHVNNTSLVFKMMDDLDKVIKGSMTTVDFFDIYSANIIAGTQVDGTYILDAEGFVSMDYDNVFKENWYTVSPDYSKIKSKIYYMCHKVHDSNIETLLSLPDHVNNYFPVVNQLKYFYSTLNKNLFEFIQQTFSLLSQQISKSSESYMSLPDKAKLRVEAYLEADEKSETYPDIRQQIFKIVLNTCKPVLIPLVGKIFYDCFKDETIIENTSKYIQIFDLAKQIFMNLSKWDGSISMSDIQKCISESSVIKRHAYHILFLHEY